MKKIKLFYSYSHQDETLRSHLEKHLSGLKHDGLIDEWHDEKISAGDDWSEEIEKNMANADIILLLFSADFIASNACQKEVKRALELKDEKNTVFIPIILRDCSWGDIEDISNIEVLPKKGKSITKWKDEDEAWKNVYDGIKNKIERMRDTISPKLKDNFKNRLLRNPLTDCALDKLFVYPDILEIDKPGQKLEKNEIDSKKLTEISKFQHKYILIEGEEQSGKTSLCNMLYLHYVNTNFYPILVNGKSIVGKADIKNIVNKAYQEQYESTKEYWSLDREKRIIIIDDINNKGANDENYSIFLKSIKENFNYAIILIDELSNLTNKSTKHNYFYLFNDYAIKSLGYKKRDELIKKCIENDEGIEYSINNQEQVARLDKDTKHIDTIIGSNIVPSYPIFIVSTFNIIESTISHDMRETSYGHCYHAMITMQLYRTNIKPEDMDQYFNFLTELSYMIFCKDKKYVLQNELDKFLIAYQKDYIFDKNMINNLINANILINKNHTYNFQYVYIYYYFVAKYIADNIDDDNINDKIEELMLNIHKKDNSNIIVFITHHTKNPKLLDSILHNTLSTFENYIEATLEKEETKFISEAIAKLEKITTAPENHNPDTTRDKKLIEKDNLKRATETIEDQTENEEDDLLLIEVRKSAKNIEIIGQIMKNQYGTIKKKKLGELFAKGQSAGLRLLRKFIEYMNNEQDDLDDYIREWLIEKTREENRELSTEEAKSISRKLVTRFSYNVIFGWIHKIVDSLGYDKLIDIADKVNDDANTIASKLINFYIHAWHKKNIDIGKLRSLHKEFETDNDAVAIYLLTDIVSRHVYMHRIDYKDKQKINDLLGFSVKHQVLAQQKLEKK